MKDWRDTYKVTLSHYILGSSQLAAHLVIERRDGKDITCNWSTIQTIKDEVLGVEVNCIEIYPNGDRVVNEVPRRHLWEVNEEMLAHHGIGWNYG